jgi:hypothetical protein
MVKKRRTQHHEAGHIYNRMPNEGMAREDITRWHHNMVDSWVTIFIVGRKKYCGVTNEKLGRKAKQGYIVWPM